MPARLSSNYDTIVRIFIIDVNLFERAICVRSARNTVRFITVIVAPVAALLPFEP